MSSAGDVNGDGYDDIIITAPHTQDGIVYVIFGHSSSTPFSDIYLSSSIAADGIGFQV